MCLVIQPLDQPQPSCLSITRLSRPQSQSRPHSEPSVSLIHSLFLFRSTSVSPHITPISLSPSLPCIPLSSLFLSLFRPLPLLPSAHFSSWPDCALLSQSVWPGCSTWPISLALSQRSQGSGLSQVPNHLFWAYLTHDKSILKPLPLITFSLKFLV